MQLPALHTAEHPVEPQSTANPPDMLAHWFQRLEQGGTSYCLTGILFDSQFHVNVPQRLGEICHGLAALAARYPGLAIGSESQQSPDFDT